MRTTAKYKYKPKKDLIGISRSNYKDFRKYMMLRPHYFEAIFGNITIKAAWNEVSKITIDSLYGGHDGWYNGCDKD